MTVSTFPPRFSGRVARNIALSSRGNQLNGKPDRTARGSSNKAGTIKNSGHSPLKTAERKHIGSFCGEEGCGRMLRANKKCNRL